MIVAENVVPDQLQPQTQLPLGVKGISQLFNSSLLHHFTAGTTDTNHIIILTLSS